MTIRDATEADLPALLEIYNDAVLNTTATYDIEPLTLDDRRAWFDEHGRRGLPVMVAEIDGVAAGWASLNVFRDKPGYAHTVENSVYVAPSFQGRGVGKALLAATIEAARAIGAHAIVAGIDADADVSIRLHESFGFEKVAYFKEVGRKFDRWLDVVFMELVLSD